MQIEEVAYIFFPLIQRLHPIDKLWLALILYGAGVAAFFLILRLDLAFSLWWVSLSLASYGLGMLVYLKRVPFMTLPLIAIAPFYWDTIPMEMACVFVAPAFAYVIQESGRIKVLKSRSLVWVGENSYGLYLIHPLLLSAFGFVGVALALPLAWGFERAALVTWRHFSFAPKCQIRPCRKRRAFFDPVEKGTYPRLYQDEKANTLISKLWVFLRP